MLYLDCSNGVAGDMLVGALLDLGADRDKIIKTLRPIADITVAQVTKKGTHATDFKAKYISGKRSYPDLVAAIESLDLKRKTERLSKRILKTLALAESKAHNTPLSQVHLHEAADIIVDAVAVSCALEDIRPERVESSTVSVGRLAPATKEILKLSKIPTQVISKDEITTPTGAAILANMVDRFVDKKVNGKAGHGAGDMDFNYPNVLKIIMSSDIVVLETNVDDCTPETLSFVAQRLMQKGALDVHIIPCLMKKGRFGFLVRVLTKDPDKHSGILMAETGTLGVRVLPVERRYEAPRKIKKITLKIGGKNEVIRVKESPHGKKSEYDDIKRLAKKHKLTFRQIKKMVDSAL